MTARSLFPLHGRQFRLALVQFFGRCGVVAILPFALYRLFEGEWHAGILNSAVVVSLAGALVAARRYGRIDGAARFMVCTTTIACLLLASVNGTLLVLWSFPILVSNLLLAGRSFGLAANLVLIVGLAAISGVGAELPQLITFVIAATLVSLYASVFAVMTDSQHDKLERLATVDTLTGAGNRRMMHVELAEKFAHARRHRLDCAVAVLDLDHFKAVNDNWGHEAGDDVLRESARLTRAALRAGDRFYRLGGEEFVLFLPRTGHDGLPAFLERLQAQLRAGLTGPGGPVTVSIGAAVLRPDDADWSAWLARADEALYRAKREGRDRYCVAEEPAMPAEPEILAGRVA